MPVGLILTVGEAGLALTEYQLARPDEDNELGLKTRRIEELLKAHPALRGEEL